MGAPGGFVRAGAGLRLLLRGTERVRLCLAAEPRRPGASFALLSRDRLGVTLTELLTTITIMAIVSYGVLLAFGGVLRVYNAAVGNRDAVAKAEAAMAFMMPRFRESLGIDQAVGLSATRVGILLPKKDDDGYNVVTATGVLPGDTVQFYLGDPGGDPSENAKYLWQRVGATKQMICDSVRSLEFAAVQSGGATVGIRVTLTTESTRGQVLEHVTTQETNFRNAA